MNKLIKSRVNKHLKTAMGFFWASLALQILVYGLLSHVIIKHWGDASSMILAVGGILLYVPFTHILFRKFKGMAKRSMQTTEMGMREYIVDQHNALGTFLTFKKRYEMILIPLTSAIGVLLTFKLFVPGGVAAYPNGAALIWVITLISCYGAIRQENRKNFRQPMDGLQKLLKDYDNGTAAA